jgi:hypothetical protein
MVGPTRSASLFPSGCARPVGWVAQEQWRHPALPSRNLEIQHRDRLSKGVGGADDGAAFQSRWIGVPSAMWSETQREEWIGTRTQPWEAGCGGIDGEPWMAKPRWK